MLILLQSCRLSRQHGRIILKVSVSSRPLSTAQRPTEYDAVVIGAGPGGLTATSNLLDQGLSRVCMIDGHFKGGRINQRYREVPSNTKTGMFAQWATGTKTFSDIIESSPSPNAYTKLLSFDQDEGCILGDAVDVAQMLSDGLRKDGRVDSVKTHVNLLSKQGSTWTLPKYNISTRKVVLAHGSHPKRHDLADNYPHLTALDLDICLKPSALRQAVPAGSKVGVIGASHSAVLALKNLYELENIMVVNFFRSPLLYAEYKDGWILYDNTGLKGVAADWAREILDGDHDPSRLRRVNLKETGRRENDIYDDELKDCTHLVSAIGYEMNALPRVVVEGRETEPAFDPLTGRFREEQDGGLLDGLFGTGIAYPERVTDRVGNVESAVGWFKFMKFVKRVAPDWAR